MIGFRLRSGHAHRLYVSGVCAGEWTPMDNTERNKGFSAIVRKFPRGRAQHGVTVQLPVRPLLLCMAWLG